MHARTPRGFTLIELLLVVVLLGLLAAVVIPRLADTGSDSRVNACRQNIAIINSQIELWAAQNGSQYPPTHADFMENILKSTDIFPDGPPQCPYGKAYVYNAAKNRVKPHNHTAEMTEISAEELPIEGNGSSEP